MGEVTVSDAKRGPLGAEATAHCAACGKEQWFLNPTPERVTWYRASHRCDGEGWQG